MSEIPVKINFIDSITNEIIETQEAFIESEDWKNVVGSKGE